MKYRDYYTKEERRAHHKKYRQKHKKKLAIYYEKWKKKNIKKLQEYRKKYRQKHKKRMDKNQKEYSRSIRGKYMLARKQAEYRKLKWNITFDEYNNLIQKPCFYSNKHQLPEVGHGLDRIDNNKGYTLENVLSCCSECNYGRGNRYTVEEWKIMIEALETYREK